VAASYPAVIDLRVNNLAALDKLEAGTKRVTGLFNEIRQQRNLFDQSVGKAATREVTRNIGKLIAGFAGAKEGARQFQVTLQKTTKEGTVEATKNVNMYSKTLAGLGSQLRAVDQILANSTVGQQEFNDALVVSNKLSRELTRNQLKAAAAEAKAGAGGVQGLLALGKQLPNSVKALELYQAELNDLQITVDRTSKDFFELGKEIKKVDLLLARGPQQKATGRGGGRGAGGGRRGGRFQDIATGAGFPLLFGGGPLQALAGGIGGAAGGLGGSIAASALIAQFEAFAKGAAEAGVALTSTSGALELVREKSLFTSENTRNLAAQLEEQGDVAGLATLLTEELVSQIGNAGVIALQDLGTTTNETTKLWGQLTTQLQILIAGPLNGFLKLVNNMIGGINDALKPTAQDDFRAIRDRVLASGDAEAIARVTAIEDQVRGVQRKNLRGGGTQVTQGGLTEERAAKGVDLLKAAGFGPKIAITEQDLQTITPGGGSTKKDIVPGLKIQVQLQERLLGLNTKIAEARRDGNEGAAAVLEVEKIFEQTAANINKIKTEGLDKEAETLKIRSEELNGLQKVEAISNRMRDAEAKEAEKAAETLKGLQNEQDLLQARLNGRLEEEQIEQRVNELMEKSTHLTKEQVEGALENTAALKEQVKALENLESMYASIGQSISSGIVDALSAAVEGTKSLADIASQTLRQVANILLQFGVNTALGGIPGLGDFFRAKGGPVSGGSPYMVGEKGPELFVPNTSGTIVPNNKLGGGGATNVVVNVDAKGSSASGDSGAGKQLGGLIGAAVQAELIKQQRPGGLLSR